MIAVRAEKLGKKHVKEKQPKMINMYTGDPHSGGGCVCVVFFVFVFAVFFWS